MEHKHEIFCKTIKEKNIPVVLYGAGGMMYPTIVALGRYGVKPECVCDDFSKQNEMYGIPVYTYNEMIKRYEGKEYHIIVSNIKNKEQILKRLSDRGNKQEVSTDFFAIDVYDDVPTNVEFIEENKSKLDFVHNLLEDKLSKDTLLNILAYKVSADPRFLSGIYRKQNYFCNDIIKLTDNEVYVDCGAFDGDTIFDFSYAVNGQYRKIFAIEPDRANYKRLLMAASLYRDVYTHNVGLWSHKDTLEFVENLCQSSTISTDQGLSRIQLEVDSLDNLIDEEVTFIKMDIEGAEPQAIVGATKLIQKYKPKLAICVYHKKNDLIDIPLAINAIRQDYKFYLRHWYPNLPFDTVLFAV